MTMPINNGSLPIISCGICRTRRFENIFCRTRRKCSLRVPRKILYGLPIALPTRVVKPSKLGEVVISRRDDPFSELINEFYKDYRLNFSSERFRTATILAGAICEVILYQLLIDQGVNPKMLSEDRALALAKLLDYVRLLKLDQAAGFPLNHLYDIQKKRTDRNSRRDF